MRKGSPTPTRIARPAYSINYNSDLARVSSLRVRGLFAMCSAGLGRRRNSRALRLLPPRGCAHAFNFARLAVCLRPEIAAHEASLFDSKNAAIVPPHSAVGVGLAKSRFGVICANNGLESRASKLSRLSLILIKINV